MDTETQEPNPAAAALREAIERAGGYTALANLVGVSRPAVAQWSLCPPKRVLQVEAITGVPRYRLRPDLYPRENVSQR